MTFDIWCWFFFSNCVGQIQSKLIYRLDRLKREELPLFWDAPEIGWSVSYKSVNQFWLNLSHPNSKNKSTSNVKKFHIVCNIFSHFNISHNRKTPASWLEELQEKKIPILFFYMFQSCNQNEKWYEAAPPLHTTMHTEWMVHWKVRILGLKAF